MLRSFAAILALFLLSYAGIAVWLEHTSRPGILDSVWCRAGFCSSDFVVERGYRQFLEGDAAANANAAAFFRQAVARDPASAFLWASEGETLLETGRRDAAQYCMLRAAYLGPRSASILLRLVNFSFRVDDKSAALRYGARIAQLTDTYDSLLFHTYDRFGVPAPEVLANGIPRDRRAAQSFLRHLMGADRLADAGQTWQWIASRSFADDALAADYLRFLLRNKQPSAAVQAWANYLGPRKGDFPRPNLLFNGGFETPATAAPFDWEINPVEGASIARDSAGPHSGKWCLRVAFDGKRNLAFNHVSQWVVLSPGLYRLAAWMKADGITTDRGVAVRLFNPSGKPPLDAATDPLRGSSDWRPFEKLVAVPPGASLVRVEIVRPASSRFDNKIGGSVWIDSLSLTPA